MHSITVLPLDFRFVNALISRISSYVRLFVICIERMNKGWSKKDPSTATVCSLLCISFLCAKV
jgi:hypothetical protein